MSTYLGGNPGIRRDGIHTIDAAEDSSLIPAPFTFTTTGTHVLVAAPGGGRRLRLRRISPTYAIRSPDSEPIMAVFVGATEAQRGNSLLGRFDISAVVDTDTIVLTIDVIDSGGVVCGTVYYDLV